MIVHTGEAGVIRWEASVRSFEEVDIGSEAAVRTVDEDAGFADMNSLGCPDNLELHFLLDAGLVIVSQSSLTLSGKARSTGKARIIFAGFSNH